VSAAISARSRRSRNVTVGMLSRSLRHSAPVKLTSLSAAQANYLNLPRSGPFMPEHYRY
jgi:hypothetical protein